ncbi:AHH domain-containing protein [Archangium lansingense]|uniref:AHH domain-containing protein n=1 Tax=Archangium lansingense TaxID=2995310 RepID=UPI003B75ED99
MSDSDHIKLEDYKDLHQPKGGAGGKGCLWSHESKYKDGHRCSYRWQAYEHAKEDKHLYNYPAYKSLCVDHKPSRRDSFPTAAYAGPKKRVPTDTYAMWNTFSDHGAPSISQPMKKKPRPGMWNLEYPGNFTGDFDKPYWHNAHHIIPRSVLQDELKEADKDDPRISPMIAQGLLRAEYNLNDKLNMVILPMDRAVAEALNLPRHLLGHQAKVGEDLFGTREETDHPNYSRRIRLMLRPVMNQYRAIMAAKLKEDHPGPPDALAREQLEQVSRTIYKAIVTAGKFMKGKSLDELKFGGVGGR